MPIPVFCLEPDRDDDSRVAQSQAVAGRTLFEVFVGGVKYRGWSSRGAEQARQPFVDKLLTPSLSSASCKGYSIYSYLAQRRNHRYKSTKTTLRK